MTILQTLFAKLGTHPLPTIALGLERIHQALDALGNPERRLPPVVHVAGTNGKGSTIAFLRAILEAAGLKVHTYTSPHLMRFNERIVLAGAEIENIELAAILEEVIGKTKTIPLTFFESTTAAAFLAFSRTPADILLLETGLGGRLDATNVVDHPVLTILTPVSYDHMDYLGESLTKIAGEKAGILKTHVPCIVAAQEHEAQKVINKKAIDLNVPLYRMGAEWQVAGNASQMNYSSASHQFTHLVLALQGTHQILNAGAAIAAAEQLPFTITAEHIAEGLKQAAWPARLQRIFPAVPAHVEVYLDGGHNAAGMKVLSTWIEAEDNPVHVVLGMLKDKEIMKSAEIIAKNAASLTITGIQSEARAMDAAVFTEQLQHAGIESQLATNWQAALDTICIENQPPFNILIAGSLYLAGEVLLALSSETSN